MLKKKKIILNLQDDFNKREIIYDDLENNNIINSIKEKDEDLKFINDKRKMEDTLFNLSLKFSPNEAQIMD